MQPAHDDKPAQERVPRRQQTKDAQATEQQADSSSVEPPVQKASVVPFRAAAHSKPADTVASAATDASQNQQPGIAPEVWQAAASFLTEFGFPYLKVAWVLKCVPRVGALTPAELQARLDALAAAYGGGLSVGALVKRVGNRPKLLTLTPSAIAASRARLADFGLAADQAARVLAAQPALSLMSTHALRSNVSSLRSCYELSAAELHTVITRAPKYLLRLHTPATQHYHSANMHIKAIVADRVPSGPKAARPKAGRVGMVTF